MKALQSGIEQVYQDNSEYPHSDEILQWSAWVTWLLTYVESIPADPKHDQPCNDWWNQLNLTDCAYTYITWPDNNSILFGEYEISTGFESEWNVDKKAAIDWGWLIDELTRYELWIDVANNDSGISSVTITGVWKWACNTVWTAVIGATTLTIINWNPTPWNECL
jgi:hypothetical protein